MPTPRNPFKAALRRGDLQVGCWLGLGDPYVAEISASAGFDWLVIDNEHSPNDLRSTVAQMQVIAGRGGHAVVRPAIGEVWMIKQFLDAGAQTILVPMVETAEQARALVAAVTYPPEGVRGVGAALGRASDFGAIQDYVTTAGDEICLLLQVESRAAIEALDEILAVEGVDGVFVGPADLSTDMGYAARVDVPEVEEVILTTLRRIAKAGKAAGILTLDPGLQARCVEAGATFVATDVDVLNFAQAMRGAATDAKARLGQP